MVMLLKSSGILFLRFPKQFFLPHFHCNLELGYFIVRAFQLIFYHTGLTFNRFGGMPAFSLATSTTSKQRPNGHGLISIMKCYRNILVSAGSAWGVWNDSKYPWSQHWNSIPPALTTAASVLNPPSFHAIVSGLPIFPVEKRISIWVTTRGIHTSKGKTHIVPRELRVNKTSSRVKQQSTSKQP